MTESLISVIDRLAQFADYYLDHDEACLLYTSDAADEL